MSSTFPRFFAVFLGFLALSLTLEAAASDAETLQLQRDLRACIDENIALVNAKSIGDVSKVLSSCDAELQAFMASITDSTRLEALRFAISGYVQTNIKPASVAQDSRG